MTAARQVRYGSLDCIVFDSLPEAIDEQEGGSDKTNVAKPKVAVVLCHGYGAPGHDLAGLATQWIRIMGDAADAIRIAEEYTGSIHLLVTDVVMPDMGGIDAVREITKFDPGAKVLMCSAMGQQSLVVEAIQAGAKDFVVKPFQPSRVLEAVQRVLG